MEGFVEKLKQWFPKERRLKLAVLAGVAGMALILLASFFPQKEKKTDSKVPVSVQAQTGSSNPQTAEEYRSDLEKRLEATLSEMEGVGRVKVMLTLSATGETIYAKEEKQSSSQDGEKSAFQSESQYAVVESDRTQTPIIRRVETPRIAGAVVLCEGGGSAVTRESVAKTVSTALGVPIGKIYVAKIK